jgi:tRNA(fMet)-specific endonuclease VapC
LRHLDTDVAIAYLRGDDTLAERLESALPEVQISGPAAGELLFGARASMRPELGLAQVRRFLDVVRVAPFERDAAEAYGRIRLELRRLGRASGEVDTLIAAVAIANEATLVTHNARHFEHIPGLILEDWLA